MTYLCEKNFKEDNYPITRLLREHKLPLDNYTTNYMSKLYNTIV